MKKLWGYWAEITRRTVDNEVLLVSAALSFRLILAIFPFIMFVLALLSTFDLDYKMYIEQIVYTFPKKIQDIILFFAEQVLKERKREIISIGLIAAVYSASNGFATVIAVLNRAYGIKETRNFFTVRLMSVFLVLVFSIILLGAVSMLVIKDFISKRMQNLVFFDIIVRYSVEITVLYVLLGFMYIISVNKKLGFSDVKGGAFFTAVLWTASSALFDFYINHFTDYSAVYGAIGAIFVFFYWIYILSFIFLVGGNINSYETERKNAAKS